MYGQVKQPSCILAVADGAAGDGSLLRQALSLARQFGARIELFLCASQQAYVLAHRYERAGVEEARAACVAQARAYLADLAASIGACEIEITVDARCESPLYEGIARKVARCGADLVIKRAGGAESARGTPDQNDWQLMRTCPATLLLCRGQSWARPARFATAIDVSQEETAGLAREVLEAACMLASAAGAGLDVLYGETAAGSAPAQARRSELLRLCGAQHIAPDKLHVLMGQPELMLPAFAARERYDLLILGALTHRRAGAVSVGTLTSKLLDAVGCDFALIKPASFRSPIAGPV